MTFDAPRVTLGRSATCDIQVPFRVISAHHLTFQRAADRYRVRDEATTNGTELNGEPMPAHEWFAVEQGAKLQVVDLIFEVSVETAGREVEAFTLAESGTLARKMLADALRDEEEERARLEILEGPGRGEMFELPDDLSDGALGAAADCTVRLPGDGAPGRAASLWFESDSFQLAPTGETTVRVNGRAIDHQTDLESGDTIGFGAWRLAFSDPLESHLRELEGIDADPDSGTESIPDASRASVEESISTDDAPGAEAVGQRRPGSEPGRAGVEGRAEAWGLIETVLLLLTVLFLLLVTFVLLVTFQLL